MGLIDWLLPKKLKQPKVSNLDFYIPQFTGKYDPELNTTYVAVCDAHARHLSKIRPFVKRKGEPATGKEYINNVLGLRLNPKMSSTQGWEIMARDYFMYNNAIAFIEWDFKNYRSPLKAIWPLDPDKNSVQVVKGDTAGQIYIKFILDGQEKIVDYDEVLLITRNAKPSTLLGQGSKAVDQTLKIIQTHYEGVEQAIVQSAFIRFIIQSSTPLTDEVKKKKAADFAKAYLGADATGVAYVDGAQDIKQVDSRAKYANAEEVKTFKDEIYEYLSSNQKILQATYTEDEYQAYYESALEPFVLKLMDELTYKLLTKGEIEKGNRIEIDVDRLQTASLKTRVMIADRYLKLPVLVPNVVSDLLFLPKSENGDKEYATLNYTDANKQNEYQGVTPDQKPTEEDPDPEADPTEEEPKK